MRTILLLLGLAPAALSGGFSSSDVPRMRSVGALRFSPNGTSIAYTVTRDDGPRRPFGQLWVMTLADGKSVCFSTGDEPSGEPEWSPDGQWIAYSGKLDSRSGLILARKDGSGKRFLGELEGTNSPLPTTGSRHRLVAGRQPDRLRLGAVRDPKPPKPRAIRW